MIGDLIYPLNAMFFCPITYKIVFKISLIVRRNSFWSAMSRQNLLCGDNVCANVYGVPMSVGLDASEVPWSADSVKAGDGDSCSSRDMRTIDGLEMTAVPGNGQVGIQASPSKKVAGQIAQLKCFYTNAHSMDNKQEDLEAIVQQENYDVVTITET
ncbi:hypothetical protein llap_20511 [Limosa lapponica baueri]|uniref:Uncharacterized protein n=1 Tax=Limosa lapponica baueri TaxID=1758121 RepID=A0A2I0T5X0_LIMLA|nr:hypothetical protein llap_20511 [Limosa lapponica baueri]